MKSTTYSEMRNQLLVISFNQPTGEHGQEIQPIVIEARAESVTSEGAVLNVREQQPIGEPTDTKLTSEELYKTLYSVSPILAEMFNRLTVSAVDEDVKATADVSKVVPVKVADIAKPVEVVKEIIK